MKAILFYYSRSGNTEKYAKKIQADLHCDILKVEPKEAYGNYLMSCFRIMKENRQKVTPKYSTEIPDLSTYDTILLGYPIWVNDVPSFIQGFIKDCNIKGKILIPFATHGMSDTRLSMETLKKICTGAEIKLPFDNGMFKKGNYDQWIKDVKAFESKDERDPS